jgi:hypothetical protein
MKTLKRVAPYLYRYESSGVYFAHVRSGGKLYRESLKTDDRSIANRKLREFRKKLSRVDPKDIDPAGTPQFGLVAEEVEKVNPDLAVRDKEGKPYSVRYDQVNAMLLNEFLKAHRRMEEQDKRIEELTAQLKQQAAKIQKVSAQLQASKPAPQVVNNNQ